MFSTVFFNFSFFRFFRSVMFLRVFVLLCWGAFFGGLSADAAPVSQDTPSVSSGTVLSGDILESDDAKADESAFIAFDFDKLTEKAGALAKLPYVPHEAIPAAARNLNYDQWRNIRFQPERSLWRDEGLPFELQFFHSGFYYDRNVSINVLESGRVLPVPFSTDLFNYPDDGLKQQVSSLPLGFAGFRIHYPIKRPEYKDEVAVFLGASYFRAVGRNTKYGLSARGLALNTALPSGEEFPWFREFWIQKPSSGDVELVVYALLDSPSCTGAYRIVVIPGEDTVMKVDSKVFFRKTVEKVGLAPLTSMYFYGETENGRRGDYRPEIHDTDGLSVRTLEGEWIWRALNNSPKLSITRIPLKGVGGFGLLQRDRNFDHYQDLEAHYGDRPSLWIEPNNGWGSGNIELIEIPSDTEFNDNIVAFWVPDENMGEGQGFSCSYIMRWTRDEEGLHGLGRVVATRKADGDRKEWTRFIIDFEGGELDKLSADSGLTSFVNVEGAKVTQKHLEKNVNTGGWRLSFQIEPEEDGGFSVFPAVGRAVRLSAVLKKGENIPDPLTETWTYSFSR